MAGYVKTREEVECIRKFMMPARFTGQDLGINFETTWDFAREVLPPIFEPLGSKDKGTCQAYAFVGNWQSAYCGPLDGALVQLMCTYDGIEGSWLLTEIMNPELAVTTGREILGECKKIGTARWWRDGSSYFGVGERKGIDIMKIEAEITGPELAPMDEESHSFEIKMFPSINGTGLEYPPVLGIWENTLTYTSYREGTGTLEWGHSVWDPTDTIPIVSVGKAVAVEYAFMCECEQRQFEDPDDVLPQYLWGRNYDDPTWYPIATRWQGVDTLNPKPDLATA